MWVHHVGNRECHSRLRHPKRFFGRNDYTVKIQSIGSLFVIVAAPETLWQTKRKLSIWLFFILASKFIPHPRILQSDFPVMRCVALSHKSTKVIRKILRTQLVYKATQNNIAIAKLVNHSINIAFTLIERKKSPGIVQCNKYDLNIETSNAFFLLFTTTMSILF